MEDHEKSLMRPESEWTESSGGRWGCKLRLGPEYGNLVYHAKEFGLLSISNGNPQKIVTEKTVFMDDN